MTFILPWIWAQFFKHSFIYVSSVGYVFVFSMVARLDTFGWCTDINLNLQFLSVTLLFLHPKFSSNGLCQYLFVIMLPSGHKHGYFRLLSQHIQCFQMCDTLQMKQNHIRSPQENVMIGTTFLNSSSLSILNQPVLLG